VRSLDSPEYRRKKAMFAGMLTIYGRNPVTEALQDSALTVHKLHLAESNRPSQAVEAVLALAQARAIPVAYHSRTALARISRNGKQDQGVAADIVCPRFALADDFLAALPAASAPWILALDGVHNPANLGMIVRSACAAGIDGILLGDKGVAGLGPLAIKASAGTLYRAPILRCLSLVSSLEAFRDRGFAVYVLAGDAQATLFGVPPDQAAVFVLGNETDGVSAAVLNVASGRLAIPMQNGVESLNVAVSAALVAYQRLQALR